MDNREKIEDLLTKENEENKKQQESSDLCNYFGCYGCNIDISYFFPICCICFYIQ